MKRTNNLYFLAIMLLLVIIISLYFSHSETFDLQIGNNTFKGSFDTTCDSCQFNENTKLLTCNCSRQDPKFPKDTTKRLIAQTSLNLSDADMKHLQDRSIMNNNGQLSIMTIKR